MKNNTTINGYGERAGNCDLVPIILALKFSHGFEDREARMILDLVQYANLHNQKPLTDDELRFIAKYPKIISKLFKGSPGIK